MIRGVLRRVISRDGRRKFRRFAERLGFQHRFLRLRRRGYVKLRGQGLEIGAFEHPAPVPRQCRVTYVDVITPVQVSALFPEVDLGRLVTVDHVIDIDRDGLEAFRDASQDFVIACHVIEHLANPGAFVGELLRVLRKGGALVIAAPDRDFTFDRNRQLTPLGRLEGYFRHGRDAVGPSDFQEMIDVDPVLRASSPEVIAAALGTFHRRREHLSVWTATSFQEFLIAAFAWNRSRMALYYEVLSDRNQFEYFGVWIKT